MPLFSALTVQMFTLFTLSVSCYSVIAPFMPLEIVKKGVDENVMGWIIGVFSLALILVSPFMSYVIDRIGRRNPIIYGSLMLGISFWMFTLVHYIESKFWFTTLLFVFRIIQGVATVLI
jgi:MFS family permease